MPTLFYGLFLGLNFLSVIRGNEMIGYIGFGLLFLYVVSRRLFKGDIRFHPILLILGVSAVGMLLIRMAFFGEPTLKQLVFIPQVLLAGAFYGPFVHIRHRRIYWLFSLISLFYILFFTEFGNTPLVNRTFFNSFLMILLCCSLFFDRNETKAILFDLGLFVLVSIATVSRSGLGLVAVIFIAFLLRSMASLKKIITIGLAASLLSLLVFIIVGYAYKDYSLTLVTRMSNMGLSSERWGYWIWYVGKPDLFNLIYGFNPAPFFEEMVMTFFRNREGIPTLHNSFLQFHVYYGALSVALFIMSVAGVARLVKRKHVFWAVAWLALLVRGLFDTILLVQRYDFIFLILLVWVIEITRAPMGSLKIPAEKKQDQEYLPEPELIKEDT